MPGISSKVRAVVTWSGGLDTTALIAYLAREKRLRVFPIFVNREQENLQEERRAVRYFTSRFREYLGSDFNDPFEVTVPIPASELKEKFPHKAEKFHALRNSDITNSAARYALMLNVKRVAVGALLDDRMFADISPKYWKIKNYEVGVATAGHVDVSAPFQELGWRKSDVVYWCARNQLEIDKSWTCWRSGPKHCGRCEACIGRKEAFRKARAKDLTEYMR